MKINEKQSMPKDGNAYVIVEEKLRKDYKLKNDKLKKTQKRLF